MGAVSVELVHLGSLYHDDVIDDASTRRTVDTVNARWGNLKAILAGDYLLARASEIAASLGTEVAGLLAATIARLCEGQMLELQRTFDPTRAEESYLASIDGQDRVAAVHGLSHRRHRGRAATAPSHRPAHPVRPQLRHGLPDRRRHPRRGGHRRRAGQAGRQRPGPGRLHAAGDPGAGRRRSPTPTSWPPCWVTRSTTPSATRPVSWCGPAARSTARSTWPAPTPTTPPRALDGRGRLRGRRRPHRRLRLPDRRGARRRPALRRNLHIPGPVRPIGCDRSISCQN